MLQERGDGRRTIQVREKEVEMREYCSIIMVPVGQYKRYTRKWLIPNMVPVALYEGSTWKWPNEVLNKTIVRKY